MLARRATWFVVVVASISSAAMAPARVSIVNAPGFSWDDEQIVVQVRVEQNQENRGLRLAAVDDGLVVRSSYEQLDGDKAPRTRWVRWGQLPAGRITLVASVFDSTHEVARASRVIVVRSRRGGPEVEDPDGL